MITIYALHNIPFRKILARSIDNSNKIVYTIDLYIGY